MHTLHAKGAWTAHVLPKPSPALPRPLPEHQQSPPALLGSHLKLSHLSTISAKSCSAGQKSCSGHVGGCARREARRQQEKQGPPGAFAIGILLPISKRDQFFAYP